MTAPWDIIGPHGVLLRRFELGSAADQGGRAASKGRGDGDDRTICPMPMIATSEVSSSVMWSSAMPAETHLAARNR